MCVTSVLTNDPTRARGQMTLLADAMYMERDVGIFTLTREDTAPVCKSTCCVFACFGCIVPCGAVIKGPKVRVPFSLRHDTHDRSIDDTTLTVTLLDDTSPRLSGVVRR